MSTDIPTPAERAAHRADDRTCERYHAVCTAPDADLTRFTSDAVLSLLARIAADREEIARLKGQIVNLEADREVGLEKFARTALSEANLRGLAADLEEDISLLRQQLAQREAQLSLLGSAQVKFQQRIDAIDHWLKEIGSPCKAEQRHCEEGTVEQIYWHYGYAVALRDVLDQLRNL